MYRTLASPKSWLSSQRKVLGTRFSEDAAFTTGYSNSQTIKLNLSVELWWGKFGYFFQKRVEKESNQTQDQARPGCVRESRYSDEQIPCKCTNITAVLRKNPTDCLPLGFTPSCSRNRQHDWHLTIPKQSSRKADDTLFPPLYLGL